MKRSGIPGIPLCVLALALFLPRPGRADTVFLFGKIGDHAMGAVVQREAGKLDGWYYYASRAKEIRLEGSVDAKGAFHLDEFAETAKSGSFDGSVKQGRWTGSWRKVAGAAPLAFELSENHDPLKTLTLDFDCRDKERDAQFGFTYHRNLILSVEGGKVGKFDAGEDSIGDAGEEQACAIALADLKQAPSQTGIILQVQREEGGDPTCKIRILGTDDLLWVRFGDASREGHDCRRSDDTMYCSPRAFWNDLILDRRTRKCRALK